MGLPAVISITEFAHALEVPRHKIEYWAAKGTIPTMRLDPTNPRSKREIVLETLRRERPELYEAFVQKVADAEPDDDD